MTEVLVVAVAQTLLLVLLSLPDLLRRERPEPISASPVWGIVVGPILEELVFRGIPLVIYLRWPVWGLVAASLSLVGFVTGHLYQWTGDRTSDLVNLAWKALCGVGWTWVSFATGSIAGAVLLHAINNTIGYSLWFMRRRMVP